MFGWDWLEIIKHYNGFVAGSVFFGKKNPSDVDFIVGVPASEMPHVERALVSNGFRRTDASQIDLSTKDCRITSGYKADYRDRVEYWDVQITTPAVAYARQKAMRRIRKHRLHVGLDKRQLYELYDQMYDYV